MRLKDYAHAVTELQGCADRLGLGGMIEIKTIAPPPRTGRRPGFRMSKAAKAKIAQAQRARWARVKKAEARG